MAIGEGDERLVELLALAHSVGWSRSMVIMNTVGTLAGALVGVVALVIALIALVG
jgi:hypothetical protein